MNKEENSVALQAGGLVGDPRFSYIPDPEDETTTQQTEPYTEEERAALDEANERGFFETVGDTVSSGLSSLGDFLMERPKTGDPYREVMKGPTRLESISDLLIGYSQADPSKPLGIQLGQAAAAASKEEKAERQRKLLNAIKREELRQAEELLRIRAKSAGILTPIQRQEVVKKIRETFDRDLLLANRINYAADQQVVNEINKQLREIGEEKPKVSARAMAQWLRNQKNLTIEEKGKK